MKKTQRLLALLLAVLLVTSCFVGSVSAAAAGDRTDFADMFANPMETDSMLKVRYWLPSGYPASSEKNLQEIDREIKELADAGYSIVELANVYEGLTASEYEALKKGDGEESYLFGSSYWKETLRQVLKSAKAYGMTVDVTMGPHWPAASDEIDINSDAVMKEAVYAVTELKEGQSYTALQRNYVAITQSAADVNLLGVYAAKYLDTQEFTKTSGYGSNITTTKWTQYALDDSTLVQLTAGEDGSYDFAAPADDYVVIEVYEHSTGATIKYATYNSADMGYTGYCLDMYNRAGAEEFFRYFEANCVDEEIVSLLKEVGGNFFEDNFSYDAKNIWTSDLPEKFREENGYDMMDVLPYTLGIAASGHSSERNYTGTELETSAPFVIANDSEYKYNRVRADMINAWSSCYLDLHIGTVMEKAAEYGMGFRTQTYGGNIDTGLCAATVTRPEGESIGFTDGFDGYSMLAAGRDMGGQTAVLSTEFAASFWDGGAYGYAWDDLVKKAYQTYSAGVNSLFFHGYSYMYSPESVWPGNHAFGTMCSGTWSSRDPQWNHIDMLSAHLRRIQYTLQQGVQKTDVAVWESLGNAQGGGPFYDGSALTEKGYSYQLFTPELMSLDSAVVTNGRLNEAGPAYQALVIDDETGVNVAYMEKLVDFAEAGLKIVFVNDLPAISTSLQDENGLVAGMMEELLKSENVLHVATSAEVGAALEQLGVVPDVKKAEKDTAVLSIHRVMDGGDIYFLHNTAGTETTVTVTLRGEGAPFVLNAWTGEVNPVAQYTTDGETVTMTLTLAARDAILLGIGEAFGTAPAVHAEGSDATVLYKNGNLVAQLSKAGKYTVQTSDGKVCPISVDSVPDAITINRWNLQVESWTSGDPDDAAVTKKEVIYHGDAAGASWRELEGIGNAVSGIGTYTATFALENVDSLGAILSFAGVGETFKVTLNGRAVAGNNQVTKEVDLDGYLVEGENTLVVEVASSLQNAADAVLGKAGQKDYGIIGDVTITPYRKVVVNAGDVVLNLAGEEAVTVETGELAYTVTAEGADKLATVTLAFAVDGLVDPVVKPAEGWYVIAQSTDGGIVTAVLGSNTGVSGKAAIASVAGGTTGKVGTASVVLTGADASSYVEEGEAFNGVVLGVAEVVTKIDYSTYDVNRDGTVNQLDITRAQRYYGTADAICDVDNSGEVDIADLILILNNYSK